MQYNPLILCISCLWPRALYAFLWCWCWFGYVRGFQGLCTSLLCLCLVLSF
uniref:Uncharacterized protein n=1 Tax=Octopus bimaculoides TaxID=37653 RepID=A0A0L8HFW2_OCTBM